MTKTNSNKFEQHLEVSLDGMTAVDLLSEHTELSRQQLKDCMQKGAVWLTQNNSTVRLRRNKKTLHTGQTLHLYYDNKIIQQQPLTAELIADEQYYSVWYKPRGMLSQGSKFSDHTTIYRWVETHIKPQRNAFLVHRLDRATNGIMLIAHSKKAANLFAQMFRSRAIRKFYKAIVEGQPQAPQLIDSPLDGKKARTRILSRLDTQDKQFSLLDIELLTGRKHQIRQHLAGIGHPIVGDRLYNKNIDGQYDTDLCLSAFKISFASPFDGKTKTYELSSKRLLPDNYVFT
jgi:tRNA pseudouridine32 synthase/23S rRNA pseudouridine746 synthase